VVRSFTIRPRSQPGLLVQDIGCLAFALCIASLICVPVQAMPQQSQQGQSAAQSTTQSTDDPAHRANVDPSKLPESSFEARGKKLVLKDGTYQLVRSYEQKGDTVRYYSVERSQWEEIPSSLVDWDATKKAEAQQKNDAEAYIEKVQKSDEQHTASEVTDVDASLEVAPGVFLPTGEGLFLVAGKNVTTLEQVRTEEKTDKGQQVKRMLSPIPIIPSKKDMDIPGKRAATRVSIHDPEFYMRIPFNSDEDPEVELMRADVRGDKRFIQVRSTNVVGEDTFNRHTLSLQRWNVAQGVYRFTLGEDLPPGEYALAVILPEGISMYVWDFGVDPPSAAPASTAASKPH
jgi:hypothetical protein